jgi:hypothetical protein
MKSEQVQRSVRARGEFQADQSAIWQDISERAARRNAMSPSMAMAGIYEKDSPSLQEYLSHFTLIGSQVGAVFMINGKVVGVDAFGKPETFSKTFKKLVESYAMDAIDWQKRKRIGLRSEVTRFTEGMLKWQVEVHASVGLGKDCRMESSHLTGFALALDDQILHMCIFARTEGKMAGSGVSHMARYSRRRQNQVQ